MDPHLRPYNKHKFAYHSKECLFLGYSFHHKGYKCLAADGKIYISKDVILNEIRFPYPSMFPSISVTPTSSTHVSIIVPLTFSSFNTSSPTSLPATPSYTQHNTPLSLHSGTSQTQNLPSNSLPSPDSVPDSSGSRPNQPTSPMSPSSDSHTCNTSSSSASTQLSSPTSSSAHIHKPPSPRVHPHNTHSMITRAKDGIVQLKLHLTLLITELEPSSYKTALKNPKWLDAMKAEHTALLNNNTWTLTSLPPNRRAIGCNWVFRIKQNPDVSILKCEARLVAKGFHQVQGFDFQETFSPVVKPNSQDHTNPSYF